MQFETLLRARVPRVRSADGRTEMVQVPWAQKHRRWTLRFESSAIRVRKQSSRVSRSCELLRLDWSSAPRIMERAVIRGLERRQIEELQYVGVDEKSFRRRQDYVSVLVDLEAKAPRVLEVVEGRDTVAAMEFLSVTMQMEKASPSGSG